MEFQPPWLWDTDAYMSQESSPGKPPDIPKVARDKALHHRVMRRHGRRHRSQAPTMPHVRATAPSEQRPTMPRPTA